MHENDAATDDDDEYQTMVSQLGSSPSRRNDSNPNGHRNDDDVHAAAVVALEEDGPVDDMNNQRMYGGKFSPAQLHAPWQSIMHGQLLDPHQDHDHGDDRSIDQMEVHVHSILSYDIYIYIYIYYDTCLEWLYSMARVLNHFIRE